jgi:hypothetical protein
LAEDGVFAEEGVFAEDGVFAEEGVFEDEGVLAEVGVLAEDGPLAELFEGIFTESEGFFLVAVDAVLETEVPPDFGTVAATLGAALVTAFTTLPTARAYKTYRS